MQHVYWAKYKHYCPHSAAGPDMEAGSRANLINFKNLKFKILGQFQTIFSQFWVSITLTLDVVTCMLALSNPVILPKPNQELGQPSLT